MSNARSMNRKNCVTVSCKGTLPETDTHTKCSSYRKSRQPVLMTKQERLEIRQKIAADRAEHAQRVNCSITDPLARRLNPSIAWMFQ